MSAPIANPNRPDIGGFVGLFIYLLIGCAIYLIAYGEPQGFGLSLVVVAVLWPFALIWWSLYWIACAIALVLMALGVKHICDGL